MCDTCPRACPIVVPLLLIGREREVVRGRGVLGSSSRLRSWLPLGALYYCNPHSSVWHHSVFKLRVASPPLYLLSLISKELDSSATSRTATLLQRWHVLWSSSCLLLSPTRNPSAQPSTTNQHLYTASSMHASHSRAPQCSHQRCHTHTSFSDPSP